MTQQTDTTTTPPPPTSAQVAGHLSVVQWISLVVAVLSGVVTVVQPMLALPQYAGIAWLPPAVMLLAAITAAATGWVKAYNVPALLIMCFVTGWGLSGCMLPNLPANPTADQIAQAQNAVTTDELILTGIETPLLVGIQNGSIKGQTKTDLLAADDAVWTLLQTAFDDASAGRNVSNQDLLKALRDFRNKVVGAGVTVPPMPALPAATQP